MKLLIVMVSPGAQVAAQPPMLVELALKLRSVGPEIVCPKTKGVTREAGRKVKSELNEAGPGEVTEIAVVQPLPVVQPPGLLLIVQIGGPKVKSLKAANVIVFAMAVLADAAMNSANTAFARENILISFTACSSGTLDTDRPYVL